METLQSNNTEQNMTFPFEDWTNVYVAVRWIQLIVAILSTLGSGSIIFYAAFQNLIRTYEVRPLFFLSVTDLLLSVSWLVGAVLFTQSCSNPSTCYNLHTVEQIFYMSSFFYTLNYVWVLYTGLKGVYYRRMNGCPMQFPERMESSGRIAIVLSCLFPVMLMVPVLTVGNSDECYTNFSQPYKCLLMHTGALYPTPRYSDEPTSCYVVHIYGIAVFLVTFLLTFLGIVVLMGKARSLYKRCMDSSGYFGDRQWATLRVLEHRMVLYPSAFFFCWGPAIFLAILILFSPKTVEGEVGVFLYILQIFYMSSFFYTLNYVWVLYTGLKGVYYRRMNGCPMQFPERMESSGRIAIVLSCLFPVMLMVPVLTVGNSDECYTNFSQPYKCLLMHTGALYPTPRYSDEPTSCYVVHIYGIAVFLVTFLLTFLGIVVLMGKARSLYKRCMDSSGYFGDRQWATLRVLEHRMVLYPSAFFFCWGPAIFLAILILFSPKTVEGEVGVFLYILQAFTSASQGLLNCLVYGWTQQQFCSLSRGAMRDVDTQTPLLRSQKKSYAALPTRGTNT